MLEASKAIYRKITNVANYYKNIVTDRRPKIVILTYHRILPEIDMNILANVVSLKMFNLHLDLIVKKFPVISMNNAIMQCKTGKASNDIQVVLTFDDGYADNHKYVFSALKQRGILGTFFVATNCISSERPLWDWQVAWILNSQRDIKHVKIKGGIVAQGLLESRKSFVLRLLRLMRSFDLIQLQELLDGLNEASDHKFESYFSSNRCMNWSEVRELVDSKMEIGCHGVSHRSLAGLPRKEAHNEIRVSKELIEKNTRGPCVHFSFPFGSKNDYNKELIDYVKKAGFLSCLLNIHGYNHIKKDLFCFKRVIVREDTDINYILG